MNKKTIGICAIIAIIVIIIVVATTKKEVPAPEEITTEFTLPDNLDLGDEDTTIIEDSIEIQE